MRLTVSKSFSVLLDPRGSWDLGDVSGGLTGRRADPSEACDLAPARQRHDLPGDGQAGGVRRSSAIAYALLIGAEGGAGRRVTASAYFT
jgi:hypothetical protein